MSRRSLPPWFMEFLARYKRAVVGALALGLLASACAALLMFTSGYLISATAMAATTLFSVMVPVACVQLFGFGRPLARYLERLASHDWVLHVTSDLRLALYRAADERAGDPAHARALGEYLGLLSDDVAHLQNLYLRVVFPSCIAYLLALGAAVLFGFFSPVFALVVVLALVVVIVVLPIGCLMATRVLTERMKALRAAEYERLADDVYGSVDWVLANRGQDVLSKHTADDAAIRTLEARLRMSQRIFSLVSTLLLAALLCGVIVWASGQFGSPGSNVNWIAAFALGFFPLIESFAVLPVAFSESTSHRDSLVRLDEYLGGEAVSEPPSVGRLDEMSHHDPGQVRVLRDESRCGAVELRDVTYSYPGAARPALAALSLSVKPGESVAVLGRSGAGKSTLASIICGAFPPGSGEVLLGGPIEASSRENAAGRAASGINEAARAVGFVGQNPYLFNRTLRDNLTLGVMQQSDMRLEEILRSVGLGDKLASLESGLNTIVGETGVGFSGGEAHRVAIARVLVAETPIVVVDEPFSALDPETERDLLDTLLRACENRTLIVITHHLAQVERFDRVVFVEDGRIDLDGTPADLLESSARFRDLVAFDRD